MKISTRILSTPNKVLHIINSLSTGGAENHLRQFVADARKRTKTILDIAFLYDSGAFADHLRNKGIKVIDLKMKRKYGIRIIWKIMRLIKSGNYELVLVQLSPTIFYVALASLFLPRVKFIVRETSIQTRRRRYHFLKMLDRFMYFRYSKIICVDKKVEEELIKWIPGIKEKTIVFRKGIIISPIDRQVPKRYDIIFVGRIIKAKGINILLESITQLKSKGVVGKAVLVGDGPLLQQYKKKAIDLGIDHTVEFTGERTDVNILLQKSRLFVLPSLWEGTPSALLEAMAAGLPVIATAVGGVPFVIDDGVDGILIPPSDVESLSKTIEKVLSNKQLAGNFGKNARKKVIKYFSIEQYSNNMLEMYDELLRRQ